ncbi:protein IWS11 [Sesamum angolense]|uniref:Protein IWS11 n=1 Tax=Sesamum angolense TaxID=2727404 RepID=A0AAE1WX02_9LAMI|nr:protein IWS11 [Sesamum angolense]
MMKLRSSSRGRKKKKNEKSAAEIALLVENVMAELEVVAEEDAELNRQGKPAINKLKKLSLLTDVLSKKQLQQEFLDHGVLTLLKNWLEPLPDGSLPNINIRAAVLKILNDVIMFFSKSDEETTANRKLAKELVDKWSRPIFNKSTRFEDMKNFEDERIFRRPPSKKAVGKGTTVASRDDDLDLAGFHNLSLFDDLQGVKIWTVIFEANASRPEAMSMDFVVRPQSKVDPDEVRAQAKQMVQDQRRAKVVSLFTFRKQSQIANCGSINIGVLIFFLPEKLTHSHVDFVIVSFFCYKAQDEQKVAATESTKAKATTGHETERGGSWHGEISDADLSHEDTDVLPFKG